MTDDRKSCLALIAGSTGGIITMMFHPTIWFVAAAALLWRGKWEVAE